MICGNYYKAVLITLLVLFGGFLGAKQAYAFEVQGLWTYQSGTGTTTRYTFNNTFNTSYFPTTGANTHFRSHLGCKGNYPNCDIHLSNPAMEAGSSDLLYNDFGGGRYPYYGIWVSGTNWAYTYGAGNYWGKTCTDYSLGGDCVYFLYSLATDLTPSVTSGSNNTRFTSFTYSTTTQYARVQGYWNATSTSGIYQVLNFYQDSTVFGKQDQESITATTTGNFDFSFFFHGLPVASSTQNKVFGLYATINEVDNTNVRTDGECATAPFSVSWAYCGQVSTLLVATSTIVNSFNYNLPPSQPLQQTYTFDECTLTHFDLGLCLADVAVGLFQPLDGDIHWESIKNLIETKAPFGYFTMAKDSLGNLSATSTPTAVITIPSHIKNVILIPLDTAIAGILWFFFLFNFYKRLKFITI